MRALWVYTVARIALFAVLYAVLKLFGVGGFLGIAIAVVLSLPLSYVWLARPRRALTREIDARVEARRERNADLSAQLRGEADEAGSARRSDGSTTDDTTG